MEIDAGNRKAAHIVGRSSRCADDRNIGGLAVSVFKQTN
jgi:hypothetical protein